MGEGPELQVGGQPPHTNGNPQLHRDRLAVAGVVPGETWPQEVT